MNINGSFTVITGAHPSISFTSNNEQAVNLVNTCLDSDVNRINSDITLENCYTQAGASRKTIKNVSGHIALKGGKIDCDASNVSGGIQCEKVHVNNVINISGHINLSHKAVGNHISSTSGAIKMYDSTATSLKVISGNITLNNSLVTGSVTLITGHLSIENSTINETLEINSSDLHIGAGSNIGTIKLKDNDNSNVNTISSGVIMVGGKKNIFCSPYVQVGGCNNIIMINGVRYEPGNPTHNLATGQYAAPAQEKVITLGKGTVVKALQFDGATCTLILKEGARFDGDHSMPGLTIQKA
ncbi:hypothetical protein [Acerihabitans sp.]|uniref:hypothetical protein n=1 Tax=Acerihabitans sp. TaxID=2811394 RepID=UPI002EDB378D